MTNEVDHIFSDLSKVRWHVAVRTFGNDHSTLIGLLVDWWISLSPDNHIALEGGPGNDVRGQGVRGQCDALFCTNGQPAGVLEVEGTRYDYTVRKLRTFLTSPRGDLQTIRFGILLLYAYEPVGRGTNRHFKEVATQELIQQVESVSRACADKSVILISLDKQYVRQNKGIRSRNEYYFGEPSRIEGVLFRGGQRIDSRVFFG